MTIWNKHRLLNSICRTIRNCGWIANSESKQHPFDLDLTNGDESIPIRVYVSRIKPCSKRLLVSQYCSARWNGERWLGTNGRKTLVLGWWPEGQIYVGWKIDSLPYGQLRVGASALARAYCNLASFSADGDAGLGIAAFKEDFLMSYIRHLDDIHEFLGLPNGAEILNEVADNPYRASVSAMGIDQLWFGFIKTIQQELQAISFKQRVTAVYNHRCAFCGRYVERLEAVHILPVTHEQSTDDTSNGIAACFLHHAAYDRGLVAFDDAYRTLLNETRLARFQETKLDGEMDRFVQEIRPYIILPPAIQDRPHKKLVRLANHIRGW